MADCCIGQERPQHTFNFSAQAALDTGRRDVGLPLPGFKYGPIRVCLLADIPTDVQGALDLKRDG